MAYREGIFPWPLDSNCLTWFAPWNRAVLFLEDFHPSRSLQKFRHNSGFTFAVDLNFEGVISSCAELVNRPQQKGTWITTELAKGYLKLHQAGYCHSIETYEGTQLVGGLYGVSIGGMFSAESMFYRRPNASKLALWYLIEYLQQHGANWIDCQVLNPFSRKLGAVEIARDYFMILLKQALRLKPLF